MRAALVALLLTLPLHAPTVADIYRANNSIFHLRFYGYLSNPPFPPIAFPKPLFISEHNRINTYIIIWERLPTS